MRISTANRSSRSDESVPSSEAAAERQGAEMRVLLVPSFDRDRPALRGTSRSVVAPRDVRIGGALMSGLFEDGEVVTCSYPGCTKQLRRSDFGGRQFCSPRHRDGVPLYEFKTAESLSRAGWHIIKWRTGSGSWEVVASVFGARRAEIVRDALSAEANERV